MTIKASSYYTGDNIKNNQVIENKYFITSDTIVNIDSTQMAKTPNSYHVTFGYRYNISARSLLEVNSDYSNTTENNNTASFSNFIPAYLTSLGNKDLFLNNTIAYTTRLNKTHALLISARQTRSRASQNYLVSPSLFKRNIYENDNQRGEYIKNYLETSATIFGVREKTNYNVYLKAALNDSRYTSAILNDSVNIPARSFINNNQYYSLMFIQGASGSLQFKKLRIVPAYSVSLVQHRFSNNSMATNSREMKLIAEPNIAAGLRLSKKSAVSAQFSIVKAPEIEQHIFENNVVENFRTVLTNFPSIHFLQTNSLKLQYSLYDLYNQFDQSFGISFHNKAKGYLPHYNVTDSLVYTAYTMDKINSRGIDLFLYTEKYIPSIQVTFNGAISHSINIYKNLVDTLQLRSNRSNITTVELFSKSAFKGPLNLENNLLYTISTSRSKGSSSFSNENLIEHFRVIYKRGDAITMFATTEWYFPNMAIKNYFTFIDYDLIARPPQRKFEFRMSMKNLLDLRRITQYDVSDFYSSSFSANCRPRSIIVSMAISL